MLVAQEPAAPVLPRDHGRGERLSAGGSWHEQARGASPAAGCTSPLAHDSAHKHVAGSADYTDDMVEPEGTLHAYLGLSARAPMPRSSRSISTRCEAAPGVVAVLTADDIPGENDVSSVAQA